MVLVFTCSHEMNILFENYQNNDMLFINKNRVCGSGKQAFEATWFKQRSGVTCWGHGEQQQCGGVECLSCHEEGAGVGVGAHRLGRPAEGKHQTQSTGADRHQKGKNCKYSLSFHSWKTQNSRHTVHSEKGKQVVGKVRWNMWMWGHVPRDPFTTCACLQLKPEE